MCIFCQETQSSIITAMEENEVTAIHFNVGGQLYQVERSLLEQYPSTMLYCAALSTGRPTLKPLFSSRVTERDSVLTVLISCAINVFTCL